MRRLAKLGKLVINGPLLDSFATSGEIRSVGALKTAPVDEGLDPVSADPMMKTGRLIFELHTWMIDKNILP